VIVLPPVVVAGPTVLDPTVPSVQVGAPVTINATLGHAGLWTGEGPPSTVVGAVAGDEYLDVLTGDLYRLGA
jgi:hypothetical protein